MLVALADGAIDTLVDAVLDVDALMDHDADDVADASNDADIEILGVRLTEGAGTLELDAVSETLSVPLALTLVVLATECVTDTDMLALHDELSDDVLDTDASLLADTDGVGALDADDVTVLLAVADVDMLMLGSADIDALDDGDHDVDALDVVDAVSDTVGELVGVPVGVAVLLVDGVLDKVGVAPDLDDNLSNIKAPEAKSKKLNISQFQNKFIANKSAKDVAKEIGETNVNQEQQQQIFTAKQSTEKKTGHQK